MAPTTPAPGMPQQLPVFLLPFNGALTTVPANGQCAYAALYASTTSTVETKLTFTNDVVRGANVVKRSVYTLMMTNLANDVACKAIDPGLELQRLYPTQPAPPDPAVATAALYRHYTQERARSVNAHIPAAFWAGPEVLRAMAQYLREPLFVIDVDAHNDAHLQRYYYQDYVLPNGDLHETGCGGAMTDATAKEMFRTYARLHVLPVIIVLKRHEGHFYGVHHGDISTRWQAEVDLTFTHAHCASHSWFQEVLTLGEYSVAQLGRVDVMEDEDQTNMIIIRGMERRDRLDVVHDRLGLPRLDSAPYDIAILADRLQALVGQMGTGSANPPPAPDTTARRGTPVRAPISNHGRVEFTVLSRILNSIEMEPELLSDRSKLRQLLKENTSAVTTWRRTADPQLKLPNPPGGRADLMAMLPWLLEHRAALHALFSYLPYPELAAKMVPMSQMLFWGALEAYDNHVLMLRRAVVDDAMPANAKEYCRTWLAACTTEQGSTQARVIARDPARWKRLRAMAPTAPSCACPGGVGEDDWYILHVLPHVAWTWPASTWGQFSIHCIGSLLHDHPALSQLCQSITTQAEWGGTIDIPSGLTWADRLVSMEAGLPAPSRC